MSDTPNYKIKAGTTVKQLRVEGLDTYKNYTLKTDKVFAQTDIQFDLMGTCGETHCPQHGDADLGHRSHYGFRTEVTIKGQTYKALVVVSYRNVTIVTDKQFTWDYLTELHGYDWVAAAKRLGLASGEACNLTEAEIQGVWKQVQIYTKQAKTLERI